MSTMELLENAINGDFAGPASEAMIQMAEAQLGVTFPNSYKAFLTRFGAAGCTGFDAAGLFVQDNDEAPMWSDVVRLNRSKHREIPRECIEISDDGTDYKYYLDTRRLNDDGECPVVVLGPGAEYVVVAENFVDFVIRRVNHQIEF